MAEIYQKTQEHLDRIQMKISPKSVKDIKVNVYDNLVSIEKIARFNKVDAQTISVEPFDKAHAAAIEGAIIKNKQDFNVKRNATGSVHVTLPPLTEERRKRRAKEVRQQAEKEKISIRNQRTDAKKALKGLQQEGASEDEVKKAEERLQKITDQHVAEIERLCKDKEKSLLTI